MLGMPLQQASMGLHIMKVAFIYLNNDNLIGRGAAYVVMAARGAGHTVDFYDTRWTPENAIQRPILRRGYEAILISSNSFYQKRSINLANFIRIHSRTPIIIGGAYPTISREKVLDQSTGFDYGCIGEGEGFIVDMLGALQRKEDPRGIQNLIYRDRDGVPRCNPVRPCTDLHTLQPMDFEIFDRRSVVREGELIPGFCYVSATRGCPFNCTYCCNSFYLNLYQGSLLRTQKVDTVLTELRHLRDNYPARLFYFGDEMILFNFEYVSELFNRIHDEIRMPYGCMFRPEFVTQKLVDLLYHTGCLYVGVGVECGDEQFRRQYLNRRMTNDQIVQAVRLLRTIPRLWITTYNMRGYPVSFDAKLYESTKKLNDQIAPDHAQYTWFYPIPGTKLHDYCMERNLVDMSKYMGAEDYFKSSVLKHPIPPSSDCPLIKGT